MDTQPLLLLLGLTAGCVSSPTALTPPPMAAAAAIGTLSASQREALRKLVAELATAPFGSGASLTVLSRDQRLTLTAGSLAGEGAAEVGEETLFSVQSISKTVTAAKVVTLAHQGVLDLDDPVREHLPGVALLDLAGHDVSSSVTLRDLLSHRSGLPHQPGDQVEPARFDDQWQRRDLLEVLTERWDLQLARAPGAYHYSNMGYVLLGAIVERAAACRFRACMEEYLTGLGLERATFDPVATGGDDVAHGQVPSSQGAHASYPSSWYDSTYSSPFGGGWFSTPALAGFGRAIARAHRDSNDPLHAMTLPRDASTSYGLGLDHRRRFGATTLEHSGQGPGFLAYLIVAPERNVVLAVATNGGGEPRPQSERFAEVIEQMLAIILGVEEQGHL